MSAYYLDVTVYHAVLSCFLTGDFIPFFQDDEFFRHVRKFDATATFSHQFIVALWMNLAILCCLYVISRSACYFISACSISNKLQIRVTSAWILYYTFPAAILCRLQHAPHPNTTYSFIFPVTSKTLTVLCF